MTDKWLQQLEALYEADKAREQAKQAQARQQEQQADAAAELLTRVRAHELLRLVQKHLLSGEGSLGIYEKSREYDRAVVLAWQGPISDARRPNPKDPDDYHYIAVGARDGQLLVNGQSVAATPDALKAALLQAAETPAVAARKKPITRAA
ncbi:MAG: hypothetical protein FOGNACKC_04165 [Anaerolineae bacterium]|nr:hypothetical protein [Anaerolineae bacterium]